MRLASYCAIAKFMLCASLMLIPTNADALTVLDIGALGLSPNELVEGSSFQGATFTSETGNLRYQPAGGSPFPGFGKEGGGASADIYVSFAYPVAALSITMGDTGCGGCDQDAFRVLAFDFTTDSLISTTDSPLFGGNGSGFLDIFTLAVPGTHIGRIVIDPGNAGALPGVVSQAGGVLLSRVEFAETVPEPATGLLLGIGIAAAALWKKHVARSLEG